MNYIKLQFGCLLILLYIICIYVKATTGKNKAPCNKYFDILLIISPWGIIFDGLTAFTVNYLDVVPPLVNLILHGIFFILMTSIIVFTFIYFVDLTVGVPKSFFKKFCLYLPGIISVITIIVFLNQLYYVNGKNTNYSMGISPIVCYVSMIVHYIMIFSLIIFKRNAISKKKMTGICGFLIISLLCLVIQTVFPESLISALYSTLLIMGLYINFEDPHIRKLSLFNKEMVTGFATLVENRDNSTGGHIKRTRDYVNVILNEIKKSTNIEYQSVVTKDYIEDILQAAPMHDIGKISTPDSILQKPGKLTDEEFSIMKQHSVKGGEIIKETFADINDPEYQKIAYEVARYHHEKWNGKGYPEGLKENEIPLHARIMAIADVFDAVSAKRCYRDALPLEVCFKIIEEGKGTDFDPELVDLFINAKDKVIEVYQKGRM